MNRIVSHRDHGMQPPRHRHRHRRIMPARFLKSCQLEASRKTPLEDSRPATASRSVQRHAFNDESIWWSTELRAADPRASTRRRRIVRAGYQAIIGESSSRSSRQLGGLGLPCLTAITRTIEAADDSSRRRRRVGHPRQRRKRLGIAGAAEVHGIHQTRSRRVRPGKWEPTAMWLDNSRSPRGRPRVALRQQLR